MIPEEGDRILFVCINNSIDCTENGSIYNRRNDLYEATRKYWPVAKDKRDKITHVVSHVHGIVQMVLKVKWTQYVGHNVPESTYLYLWFTWQIKAFPFSVIFGR